MEPLDKFVQIVAGKLPFKGLGDDLVMALKMMEALGQDFQGVEVVWGEHLALNDREVDLDLVEPTGVDGTMYHPEVGVTTLQPLYTSLAPVRGAIVHNPEHPPGGAIGFLCHRLSNQSIEGSNTAGGLAPAKEFGTMYVHGGHIGPCAQALILVFYFHRPARLWGQGWMDATPRLNAGLLIGRNHKFIVLERLTFPLTLVEI